MAANITIFEPEYENIKNISAKYARKIKHVIYLFNILISFLS